MTSCKKSTKHYNQKYFNQRDHLAPSLAAAIRIFAHTKRAKKILDVGCGTGRLIEFLNSVGFQAFGCDISQTAVKYANQINRKRVAYLGFATQIPFPNQSFDMVTAISLIEHLTAQEAEQFAREAKRILKPQGFIFLVTPNWTTPIRLIQGRKWFGYNDPTHIKFYTPMGLAGLLKKNSFRNIKFLFKTDYNVSFDWEFPFPIRKYPKLLRSLIIYLLFSTPLTFIRNSFWIAAQKK